MSKIEDDLAQAVTILLDYFRTHDIPFALIGAMVPQVMFSKGPGQAKPGVRATRDVDYVVKLSSWDDWEAMVAYLMQHGFKPDPGKREHCFLYKDNIIDLIPYGVSKDPNLLIWPISKQEMNLLGVSDAIEHAIDKEILPGVSVPVVPLWAFVALKITAFRDRDAPRDLQDVYYVLEHYALEGERRFEVSGRGDITYETAGAFVMGRDISENMSKPVANLVKGFLASIGDEYHPVIGKTLGIGQQYIERRRKQVFEMYMAFQSGILG